jgi:NADPH:quinone reductase-like Zn-dependent oxidoreductase
VERLIPLSVALTASELVGGSLPRPRSTSAKIMSDAFSRDGIASKIDKVLPLSRIEDAHHHLNSNSEIGKIVVVP